MRSALFNKLPFLLLLAAIAHCQGPPPQMVNPRTQIRWPVSCTNANQAYSYNENKCLTVGPVGAGVGDVQINVGGVWTTIPGLIFGVSSNALHAPNLLMPGNAGVIIPPNQVTWPSSCSSGVWSPSANGCVPTGSTGNPVAPTGSAHMNAGGVFAPIPGFTNDANYGWVTAGGMQYAKGHQSGSGWNGITNAVTNGQVVLSDPGYVVRTTASMTTSSLTITVANPAGIVAGQYVAGNVTPRTVVLSVAGNNVVVSAYPLSNNAAAPVTFFETPYGLAFGHQNFPNATQAEFLDRKLGYSVEFKRDPPGNPVTGHEDFNIEGCLSTKRNTWVNGGPLGPAGTNETCHLIDGWFGAPSTNYGTTSSKGPSNWGVSAVLNITDTVSQQGIGEAFVGFHAKAGIGDGPQSYLYYADYLGSVSGSDEGQGGQFTGGGEASTTYTGTVLAGGGGTRANACTSGTSGSACQLSVNCITDCSAIAGPLSGGPGDGRYMLDLTTAVSFNMISRTAPLGTNLPGTITIDARVPVSTFWGTLAGDVSTPAGVNSQGTPFSNGTTDMTFSVNTGTLQGAANAGNPQVGDLVCFGWPSHEQARIKSVNSGTFPGPWNITVPLRMPHTSGSWMMSNGTCGSYIDFSANDVLTSEGPSVTLHYPFESIGSTETNTLVYVWFHTNAINTNNMSAFPLARMRLPLNLSTANLTNSGGIVTVSSGIGYVGQPAFFYQPVVTFTGAANSAYNMQCFNTLPNAQGQLTCTQASSIGQAPTTGATISIGTSGYGNTAGVLWQGGEVLDILDYSETNCATTNAKHAPCFDSKNFTLEPNAAPWANGDRVEEPHHYAAQITARKDTFLDYNPQVVSDTNGARLALAGPGICCGTTGSPTTDWAGMSISNNNAASMYITHGGLLTPPGGIDLNGLGVFNYGLYMDHAPDPGGAGITGGMVIGVGCPAAPFGCTDRNFTYALFNLATKGNNEGNQILFSPFNGEIILGNGSPVTWNSEMNGWTIRDNIKFAAVLPPKLTLTPSMMGGKVPDGNYCYYIVTRNSAGVSPSPEETCTSIAAISVTGNIVRGSTTVSAITPMTGLSSGLIVGAAISGTGIPAGATIVSYAGSSLVMSAAATATTTAIPITIDSVGGNSSSIKLTWTRSSGATSYYICGRTTRAELKMFTNGGVDQTYYTDTYGTTPSGSCTITAGAPTPDGGVDQAGQIGINSPGTAFEDIIKAPVGMTASVNFAMPDVTTASGTLGLGILHPTGTPTYSPAPNVTSCGCAAGYTCTNTRGRLTIVGGTATTGVICTMNWSAGLSVAPFFTLREMGAATLHGLDHNPASVKAVQITSAVSVAGATINLDYETQP